MHIKAYAFFRTRQTAKQHINENRWESSKTEKKNFGMAVEYKMWQL